MYFNGDLTSSIKQNFIPFVHHEFSIIAPGEGDWLLER